MMKMHDYFSIFIIKKREKFTGIAKLDPPKNKPEK